MFSGQWLHGAVNDSPLIEFSRWVLSQMNLEKPRVLHVHDWHAAVVGVALQRRLGLPLVLHMHSTHGDRMGPQVGDALFRLERWAMQQADLVIAVSQWEKRGILQRYEIEPEKVKVVSNGLYRVPTKTNSESSVTRKVDLLWVGRLCEQKNPRFMLEVFHRLHARVPGLTLRMIGSGEQRELMQHLIEFKGLQQQVQLFPMIAFEKLQGLYAEARLLCMTSAAEPFGLVALEAAAAGCLPMLSNTCGVQELLATAPVLSSHDVDAWVVALEVLLNHPELLAGQQQAVQKEAASATWEDAARKCIKLYRELLG